MILGLELAAAFVAGIAFEIGIVLLFGKRMIRWVLRKQMLKAIYGPSPSSSLQSLIDDAIK